MAYSYVRYTGNGTTTNYTFPFNYLSADHVKVRVNGALVPGYTFLNSSTVKFDVAPTTGAVIEIRRETPKDVPIVNFQDGSVLLERDLDLLALFDLYLAQESADGVSETISADSTGRWNAQAKRLGNLAPAINPDEAVIKQTLDYEYPAVSVVAGARSDIAIVASDLGEVTGTVVDNGLITESIDSTPGAGSSYIVTVASNITPIQTVATNITAIQGAPTSASNAAASAAAAASSASSASSSASSATSSASAALSSKNSAETAATTATTKASEASTSAASAAGQASAASGSASAAATSASNAATAATQAASSASSASTSATNSASSATSAASSATSASASAATATTKASEASTSASNAASSATAASSSATSASGSASAASTSATNAANSASAASTSATSASGSASAASTSASNASSSASAAATSATNAASSATSAQSYLAQFRGQYIGPLSSAPTVDGNGNAVTAGDLYFDTTSSVMRVYNGSGWQNASSSINGTAARFRYIATSGQTTFSGSDTNANTLTYDPGYIDVYLNGIRLDSSDYTASSGSSVVLATGATTGDDVNIVAYGTFTLASVPGTSITDNTLGVNKLTDTIDLGVLP